MPNIYEYIAAYATPLHLANIYAEITCLRDYLAIKTPSMSHFIPLVCFVDSFLRLLFKPSFPSYLKTSSSFNKLFPLRTKAHRRRHSTLTPSLFLHRGPYFGSISTMIYRSKTIHVASRSRMSLSFPYYVLLVLCFVLIGSSPCFATPFATSHLERPFKREMSASSFLTADETQPIPSVVSSYLTSVRALLTSTDSSAPRVLTDQVQFFGTYLSSADPS